LVFVIFVHLGNRYPKALPLSIEAVHLVVVFAKEALLRKVPLVAVQHHTAVVFYFLRFQVEEKVVVLQRSVVEQVHE
jgi:hypothetical protein